MDDLYADIQAALTQYLTREIPLAEFRRRLAPLAWRAEEEYDESPGIADFVAMIDLRLAEHSDHYWNEEQLRDLLGRLTAPSVSR